MSRLVYFNKFPTNFIQGVIPSFFSHTAPPEIPIGTGELKSEPIAQEPRNDEGEEVQTVVEETKEVTNISNPDISDAMIFQVLNSLGGYCDPVFTETCNEALQELRQKNKDIRELLDILGSLPR